MTEKEQTLPQLRQEQQALDHKISRATEVANNILTPDWIEKCNPKAQQLRLGTDHDPLFKNLERAVNIRYRLMADPEKAVIPAYQSRLAQVIQEIEKIPETSTKIESFTPQQAALLGALIANRNGALIKINGSHTLTFTADAEILQTCQKLQHTAIDLQAIMQSGLSRDQYIESTRGQVLSTLKQMLEAENIESIIDSQGSSDVETILTWLYLQNDKMLGLLPDFLGARLDRVTTVTRRGYMVAGISYQWVPSGEVLSRVKRRLQESQIKEADEPSQLPVVQKTKVKETPSTTNYALSDEETFVMLGCLLSDSIKNKLTEGVVSVLEEELKMVLEILQSLTSINQTDYPFGSKSGYLQLRSKALHKLQGIISADPAQQKLMIGQQQNEAVKRFFRVLYQQNSNYEVRGAFLHQIVQEIRKRSASQIKRGENNYYEKWLDAIEAGRKKPDVTTQQEQNLPDQPPLSTDDEKTPESITSSAPIFEQPPARPRIADIERRDPQVREKVNGYLDQVLAHDSLKKGQVNRVQINREFQRLKASVVDNMLENDYIRPVGKDRHANDLYDVGQIVQMLYYYDHGNQSLRGREFSKEMKQIIGEEFAKRNLDNN